MPKVVQIINRARCMVVWTPNEARTTMRRLMKRGRKRRTVSSMRAAMVP